MNGVCREVRCGLAQRFAPPQELTPAPLGRPSAGRVAPDSTRSRPVGRSPSREAHYRKSARDSPRALQGDVSLAKTLDRAGNAMKRQHLAEV
jgi:hypothetical protein